MHIHQHQSGFLKNFSYFIVCKRGKKGLVIDPHPSTLKLVEKALKEGISVTHIVNTHTHHDHIGGNDVIKEKTGALICMHPLEFERKSADKLLNDGDTIELGNLTVQVMHTPGHSPGSICLLIHGNLFTGDTLFVGDSGRTDLDGGDRPTLGASIRRLMTLPDNTVIWPGHNYGKKKSSTIKWEKSNNVNAKEYGFYVEK